VLFYLYGYTRYWGGGLWRETCDIIIPASLVSGADSCYLSDIKTEG
jgi:hypothetical protein